MLTYYYDIKSEDSIPLDGSFTDPYDRHVHKPNRDESLPDFIKRIEQGRAKRNCPTFPTKDLRQLVIDQLLMTCDKATIQRYFVKKKALPGLSSVFSLITTVAYDLTNKSKLSVKEKERRLEDCVNGCPFNRKASVGGFSKSATNFVAKLTKAVKTQDITKTRYETDPVLRAKVGNCAMCGGCNLIEKKEYSTEGIVAGLTSESLDRILPVLGTKTFSNCFQIREGIENPKTRKAMENRLAGCKNVDGLALLKEYEDKKGKK